MSHNRVGDAIKLIDLAPSGEFRRDLRAKLVADFASEEAEGDGVTDLVAAPRPDPDEVYVTLTSDKSPGGLNRRIWKTMLAAAACLAVVATGLVIANRDAQFGAPRELRDVNSREALQLAVRGLIAPEVLDVVWMDGQSSPDTERPKKAAATIAAMPACAVLISAGLFPPTTKAAAAYQFVPDGYFFTQRVFVYTTAEDASAAMDFIDGDAFQACWFNLFDRVTPLVGGGTTASEAWNAPRIAPHGDRQVIIGQHITVVRGGDTTELHLVNGWVQVGRAITWIDPRLEASTGLSGVEQAIAAAATALKNATGS